MDGKECLEEAQLVFMVSQIELNLILQFLCPFES